MQDYRSEMGLHRHLTRQGREFTSGLIGTSYDTHPDKCMIGNWPLAFLKFLLKSHLGEHASLVWGHMLDQAGHTGIHHFHEGGWIQTDP